MNEAARTLTLDQVTEFNKLYSKALRLAEPYLIADKERVTSLGLLPAWRLRRASSLLEASLKVYPNSWQAMLFLGKIAQRTGDHDSALSWLTEAAKVNPGSAAVLKETAGAALRQGEHRLALALLRDAVTLSPEDPAIHSTLGIAYLLTGSWENAIRSLNDAASREPYIVTAKLLDLAEDVASGRAVPPANLGEVYRALGINQWW